jgi:hypothetical protein
VGREEVFLYALLVFELGKLAKMDVVFALGK